MNAPTSILVVDDDADMRFACACVLGKAGYAVTEADSGAAAIDMLGQRVFDLVITDVCMPGPGGMEILAWLRSEAPGMPVIVITGYATVDLAVEAMKNGAADFLSKPFTPEALRIAVERSLHAHRLSLENQILKKEIEAQGVHRAFVGSSEPIQRIRDLVARVGPTDSTVLIAGESGTGKEVVARAVWQGSSRRDRPFVVVDCGALVGTLFESELFGHMKGSFTSATTTKHGRLELASSGTVFFDEIGNVGIDIQAKLLRVLQEREITRVGSTRPIPIDVRIIAATNRNLPDEIRAGRFREDLYYRLCVVPIIVPPLRQRAEDIPLLAAHFLELANRKCHKKVRGFSEAAMAAMMAHPWPGNVRELENIVERAVVLADGDTIDTRDLLWLGEAAGVKPPPQGAAVDLREVEREHVLRVLRACGGNQTAAARLLGIDRKTLWRRLRGAS
ncbi:MAG TPA: sigma-54 dependent transcriptional regulator [Thermoanaerobaculaceae bacterium]|nr:sigma-54 dependent transcriptional regulator [Thermoanaerobaculaceae bacterium]HRS16008.1 sigma-54 dependent transcriptional regulator [Thermoanaerobaculaceae bacterium]